MGFNYSFILEGETVAKKNSKQIIYNKKTGKPLIISSKNYSEWHKSAFQQLKKQMEEITNGQLWEQINKPCEVLLYFTHGDHRRRDSDNGTSSIFDLLVDACVIADDNYQIIQKFSVYNFYEKNNAHCEVIIKEL